jgi:hypothetical protein
VPDLVNVGTVGGLCDVDFARIDELLEVFLSAFPQDFTGGALAMVKQPG